MQRVKAGGYLHRLNLVNGFTVSIKRTSQIERRTAIGIMVFYDKILHFLSIHKRGCERMFLRLYIVIVFKTVLSQQFFYLLMRARCNFVYHRPRERDFGLIPQIVEEGLRNESVLYPALGISLNTSLHLITIVRAVVH